VTHVCADALSKCGLVGAVREPILAYRYRPDWSGLLPRRTAGLGGGWCHDLCFTLKKLHI